jgi:AraC family transcriptional activator of pobA
MKNIPMHLLQERTSIGLDLKRFKKDDLPLDDDKILGVHRDDHYMFFVFKSGSGSLMIDFNDMYLSGPMLYYVLPTQAHNRIRNEKVDGWLLAVDTALIPAECRYVFESSLLLQQPYSLNDSQLGQYCTLLTMIDEKYKEENTGPFYVTAIHALLQSFLATAAGHYEGHTGINLKASRLTQLTGGFKNLLTTELRIIKSPAAYAARLNVSESYLNEALKKTTGLTVSYWIHQEVMMEAKRLLYYSGLTVKEIAHNLGYDDHSYFSRIFRKVTGVSAIAFREQYRK